jgi:hypothetical protein
VSTLNLDNLKLGAYDVTWKSNFLGAVDSVEPNMDLVLKEKRVGSLGAIDVGHWILGLTGTIVTNHREITAANWQKVMPWWSSGSIPMVPTDWHKDLYEYAGLLTLHPRELGATTTFDLSFLKAAPRKVTPPPRNGDNPDVLKVEWVFYPDRSVFGTGSPLLSYGFVGAVPPPPPPP